MLNRCYLVTHTESDYQSAQHCIGEGHNGIPMLMAAMFVGSELKYLTWEEEEGIEAYLFTLTQEEAITRLDAGLEKLKAMFPKEVVDYCQGWANELKSKMQAHVFLDISEFMPLFEQQEDFLAWFGEVQDGLLEPNEEIVTILIDNNEGFIQPLLVGYPCDGEPMDDEKAEKYDFDGPLQVKVIEDTIVLKPSQVKH